MTMTEITAPYGFVPLSDKVVCPDWLKTTDGQAPPVHDVPFEDGLCGTLELEITAETPIFVRGTDETGEKPFQLADGRYAIPSTSIRGALRNIVEIISFSRFSRVNDHRYAVRDLKNRDLYCQHMAGEDKRGGKFPYVPLVNAGWLKASESGDGPAVIEVCDFAKFEYGYLEKFAKDQGVKGFKPGRRQIAREKYKAWTASRVAKLPVSWRGRNVVSVGKLLSQFGEFDTKSKQIVQGTIVFTGQPQQWEPGNTQAKHHDFFFTGSRADLRPIDVPKAIYDDFEFAHSNRGQQNKLGESLTPNDEWGFWKPKFKEGERVPVFFLTNPDGSLRAFGLAMMFRLPYDLSIHDAVKNAGEEHLDHLGPIDMGEALFGTVRDTSGGNHDCLALKGRVGFSHATAVGRVEPMPRVEVVLGGPKASYYPNYVEQHPTEPGSVPGTENGKQVYWTWMDKDAKPRGWKRYKSLTSIVKPTGSKGSNMDKVGTRFHPLPAGTKFRCHVDVHNLRPEELGALLWALSLGGDSLARHGLGMARPLGYGRSTISVVDQKIVNMRGQHVSDLESSLKAFTAFMNSEIPTWERSHQIRELLALSRPTDPSNARYQTLSPNEFQDAKSAFLALPSAAGLGMPKGWARGASGGGRGVGGVAPAAGQLKVDSVILGSLLDETTKKGGECFGSASFSDKGILHPTSSKPDGGFEKGKEYRFLVKSTGPPAQLWWINPDAPPPAPPKPKGGPKKGPGGNRGFKR